MAEFILGPRLYARNNLILLIKNRVLKNMYIVLILYLNINT